MITCLRSFILVLLFAATSHAVVANSPHDMVNIWGAGAAQGICSYCHVPHSAQGARLWPSLPDAGIEADFGIIGSLCYTCHGFQNFSGADQDITDTVYDNITRTNHPLTVTGGYPNTDAVASGYPYTAAGNMECSSCHNVHEQTASSSAVLGPGAERNFLRSPYYVGPATFINDPVTEGMFCTDCHQNRAISAVTNVLGTHPVGGDVDNGRSGTPGTVNMNDPRLTLPFGTDTLAAGDGQGGGHSTNVSGGPNGAVACWTCHAPHGAESRLLAYTPADANNYSVVCEVCHGVMPSLSDPTDLAVSSHPVDAGTGDDEIGGGLITISITRPFSDALGDDLSFYSDVRNAFMGISGEVVCLSCHVAHEANPGTPIFRHEKISPNTGICDDCHGTVFAGRATHPIGPGAGNIINEDGGTWPNNDILPLFGATNWVQCDTCHAGHNAVVSEFELLRVTDDNSAICVGCHTDTPSDDPVFGEAAGAANPSAYIREAQYSGIDYGVIGSAGPGTRMGTHAAFRTIAAGTTPDHQQWRVTLLDVIRGAQIPNSYGTDGNTIICQSCHTPHDAAPSGGWGGSAGSENLLYYENGISGNRTGIDGGGTVGGLGGQQNGYSPGDDSYCQACHVPSGTHPVQDWTVSRTGFACSEISPFVNTPGAPVAPADYSLTGVMTCESCHAPHSANTATGSFILETGTGTSLQNGGDRVNDRNRDDLCWLCHAY